MEERKGFLPYIERKAENMEVYIIMAAVAAAMLIISGLALFGFALIKKAFDASLGSFLKFFLNDSDRIETAERLKIPIHGRNVVCHCFLYCFLR